MHCYRKLLRTCKTLFRDDVIALGAAQKKVREAFIAQKNLTDKTEIKNQIQIGLETEEFLRQRILQAKLNESENVYKINITKDTKLHDNVPLKEVNVIDLNKYTVPDKFKNR